MSQMTHVTLLKPLKNYIERVCRIKDFLEREDTFQGL